MERLTKAQMTERLGKAPEAWTFLGQCYQIDGSDRVCMLTDRRATVFFTLKPKDGSKGRVAVSSESIDLFKRWNPDLYVRMKQGQMFLQLRTFALATDREAAAKRTRVRAALVDWSVIRRRARALIQNYRRTVRRGTLPEYLRTAREIMQEPVLNFRDDDSRALWIEQQVARMEKVLSLEAAPPVPDPMDEIFAIAREEEVRERTKKPEPVTPFIPSLSDIPEIF